MDNWTPLSSGARQRPRYSLQEYDEAIKNAQAAQDTEAVARLQQARELEQAAADVVGFSQATTEEEKRQYNPLYGMGGAERFARGGALAARDLGRGAAEIVGLDLPPRSEERVRQDQALMQTPSGVAGNIAGNVAAALPAMAIPGANTVTGATLIGAGMGALRPTGGEGIDGDRLKNVATGAAGGFVGGALARGASRVLSPRGNAAAQQYLDEGVNLTPGQRLGGMANRVEQKLTSAPFIGDDIGRARLDTRRQFNIATINRFLEPLGKKVDDAGYEGLNKAKTIISQQYDDIFDQVKYVQVDGPFARQMAQFDDMAKSLPDEKYNQLARIVKDKISAKINPQNGRMDAQSFKEIVSELKSMSRNYISSGLKNSDYDTQRMGAIIGQIEKSTSTLFQRQYPGLAGPLAKADYAWAGYLRAVRAASSVGADGGVFTPSQLNSAIKAMESNKNQFGLGRSLMQDWANPAKEVIGDTVADSGTAGRLAALGTAAYGPAALFGANPMTGIAGLGAAKAASSMMYSPTGRQAMGALLGGSRPDILRMLGDQAQYLTAPTGAMAGAYLGK